VRTCDLNFSVVSPARASTATRTTSAWIRRRKLIREAVVPSFFCGTVSADVPLRPGRRPVESESCWIFLRSFHPLRVLLRPIGGSERQRPAPKLIREDGAVKLDDVLDL
jgi:hypothetical protein